MKNKNTIKWLWRVPGRKKWLIALLLAVQTAHGASGVLYALLLRNIVDSAVQSDVSGFFRNVWLVILLVLAQIAMRAVLRHVSELSRASLENAFKQRMTENLLKKDYAKISAVHSGEWLNRLTNDTVVVANGCTDILPGLAGTAVKMISAVVMLIILQPGFTWLVLPGGILVAVFTYAFRKLLKKLHKNVQEKDGRLRIFLQESIGNMMMIRSFAAEKQTAAEAAEKAKDHKAARMKKIRFSNFCNVGLGICVHGMYLFGICWCAWGILTGIITFGTLTAVTQLISQIQQPFVNISGYLPRIYAVSASAERLMEIESFPDDHIGEAKSTEEIHSAYDRMVSVGMNNVSYTYYPPAEDIASITKEQMPVALKNISFSIGKGEYVAFTGHSGCGKSTAIKLLMSVYKADEGSCSIVLDDKEEELSSQWHRLFAYVPQGNKLMSGTVRDAVAFADRARSDDDAAVANALKVACAYDFVSELENGIDTVLGERGTGLSEGQTQRISIARAIFADSPILILDEATSSLDSATEQRLLENLRKMTDKTVIIVTHRPAALSFCDRVLEFTENGLIEK